MEIDDPGNVTKVDNLYVYMSVDANGNQGILAAMIPTIGASPLVTGDANAAKAMQPVAEAAARDTGKRVELFIFNRGQSLWKFDPRN